MSSPDPVASSPRVVVVGAGIAGLAAAAAMRRERPAVDVVVLDAATQIGGKLKLGEVAGVTIDVGAESMLNRRPEGVAFAAASGLSERLTHPATTAARIWSRGALRPMPRSLLGIPVDVRELAASGLLTEEGVARAALDAELPATAIGDDVSVGWLVEQRFGRELLERLVEPLLGGVYAGHADELSARAATPQLVGLLQREPSMTRAAAAVLADTADTPVFAGLVGGLGQLPSAVVESADLDVRTRTTVRELTRAPNGWDVVVGPTIASERIRADAVVLATPAAPTSRLLADPVPRAAVALAEIEYASMAVVTLAFPASRFPVVEGSGFLVPPVEGREVKAATYSFAKWDWVRRASSDVVVMRTSIGRHREEGRLQVEDEELVARSIADLADMVGLRAEPVDWHVERWGGGLPQYAVGHLDRVRRIRSAISAVPGLAVCGATYDGLGIPACIASAHLAARQILDQLPEGG